MKLHTLHIGTNYTDTHAELSGCLNDARDLYELCRRRAASSTKLLGTQADRTGIVSLVKHTLHRLERGDLAFISFSGHGTTDVDASYDEASGSDQALVCDDFELIYDDEVADALKDRASGSYVIALLDCCHSQTMHRGLVKKRSIASGRCKLHDRKKRYRNPRALPNCGFIAGCEENGYSFDGIFDGRPNGALTYYTIKAFKQLKRGATFGDLFNLVGGKRPKGYLPNDEYPQQPTKMGSAANFARRIPFR